MIIACPTCAGPFQVLDEQIAPLLQVACPHCSFRLILDFEAANDPSLIDPGTQMASGYRSEADSRSVAAGAGVPTAAPPSAPPPAPAPTSTPAPKARPTPKAAARPAPPPPAHGTGNTRPQKPSKKTLIASPGMMAAVPKHAPSPPGRPVPRPMAKTTSSQAAMASPASTGASGGDAPHVPAPREAAPSWPADAAPPPNAAELSDTHAKTPAELSDTHAKSHELTTPVGGGALKASPAPTPPPRSPVSTALLFTGVVLLAFIGALWIVAFQKTGDIDPRPFVQQTLIPMLRAKLTMLVGG